MRIIVSLLVALTLSSCAGNHHFIASPIAAVTVSAPHQASYDSNAQNSGIIGIAYDGKGGIIGRIVTTHFRERYTSLVEKYGDQFHPTLTVDAGFTEKGNDWVIDMEHYIYAGQMIQWQRDGRQPTSTFKKLLNKI